jgi:23S rRNA (pseudouridine1915-N3)-methyltransferase
LKIQLVTIGKPKLLYAKLGWEEYISRLQRLHTIRLTQIPDKFAYDTAKISEVLQGTYVIVMEINGTEFTSIQLATYMKQRELEAREVSFVIGGPEGLPQAIIDKAQHQWSIGRQTLPHDLAMVVTVEAVYRASTINAGLPYHK